MNPRMMRLSFVSAFVILASAASCKKNEPAPGAPTPAPGAPAASAVKVTEVQLGNELGTDKRVKTAMTAFATKDTIFAAVVTEGTAPAAELTARWTFQDGQLINETKRSIVPTGKEVTEFSIQKPDGWPAGDYKLEITLDGKPAETRTFKVSAKPATN